LGGLTVSFSGSVSNLSWIQVGFEFLSFSEAVLIVLLKFELD